MDDALYEEMFRMEQSHWWFCAKHRIVRALLDRFLPGPAAMAAAPRRRRRVADLGCGCGMMLQKLRGDFDAVGMDDSPQAIGFCARRGVRVTQGRLPDQIGLEPGTFDAVLMLDVLEHLDQDAASAAAAARLLGPGGILLCTVPAYPWLYGPRDAHHHHRRRYTRGQFGKLFDLPGMRLEKLSYFNSLLFLPAAAARLKSKWLGDKDAAADLTLPPAPINRVLQTMFAAERHWLIGGSLPFGLSLLAICRRENG